MPWDPNAGRADPSSNTYHETDNQPQQTQGEYQHTNSYVSVEESESNGEQGDKSRPHPDNLSHEQCYALEDAIGEDGVITEAELKNLKDKDGNPIPMDQVLSMMESDGKGNYRLSDEWKKKIDEKRHGVQNPKPAE